jgi:hypothetical protein
MTTNQHGRGYLKKSYTDEEERQSKGQEKNKFQECTDK